MYAISKDCVINQARRVPGLWIPVIYAITLIGLSQFHRVFDEWGGVMLYFSGREIIAGMGYHGWTSYFWPPLFSFLIGVGSLILPGFLAGKLISILSASALLFVAFHFAGEMFHRKEIGWWAQAFLTVSPIYVYQSLLAHNHMLDALLFVTGLYLFLRSLRDPKPVSFLIAGLACGLAGLTRYTSYVLFALPLITFVVKPGFWRAAKWGVAFWIGFIVICLPWWYANTADNGSPFYSLEHLNICTAVVAHSPGNNDSLWWCANQNLKGIADLVAAYPREYVRNFVNNVFQSIKLLIEYGGVLALFVVPAVFESIFFVEPRHWMTIFGVLASSVTLVSQAFVNEWYLLGWIAPIIVITVMFVLKYLDRIMENFPNLKKYHVSHVFLAFLVLAGLGLTLKRLVTFTLEDRDYLLLGDIERVTQALKEHDSNLQSKVVMANDPVWAYYAGSKYLVTPEDYEGTLEAMVSYSGISEQVKNYAPKYPTSMAKSKLQADYLIYFKTPTIWIGPRELPQFSFLLNPGSDKIPNNFELVYQSPDVVAYEIH
jgi:hypothetical protein